MKKYLPTFEKGFTLIELMVVVTIIAFLSVIGIVAFSNAQAQARDGRRRADIDAIATAMESNRNLTAGTYTYISLASTMFANSLIPCDPLDQTPSSCASNGVNAAGTPIVYAGASDFGYKIKNNTLAFVACARLEKGGGNASAVPSDILATDTKYTITSGTDYFCRASQQ